MADDLDTVLARVRAKPVCTLPDFARLIDRSPNRVYQDARERGEVAGISVIHVSEHSVRLPSRAVLELLSLDTPEPEDT